MTIITDARSSHSGGRQGAPVALPSRSTVNDEIAQLQELLSSRRTVSIASLASLKYQLRMPIFVEMVTANGAVVASSDEFGLYAEAPTESECIRDFRAQFVADFEFLSENADELGSDLAERLTALRDLIQERQA